MYIYNFRTETKLFMRAFYLISFLSYDRSSENGTVSLAEMQTYQISNTFFLVMITIGNDDLKNATACNNQSQDHNSKIEAELQELSFLQTYIGAAWLNVIIGIY